MLVFVVLSVDVVIYLCHRRVDNEDNVSVRSDTARLVMDSEKQDCIPGVPCIYSDSVDFRIVMMTFNRAKALQTTLDALNDLELDGDSAALEIWIDRDVDDHVDSDTLKTAKEFKWKLGHKRVHVQHRHVGIYGQWIDTWRPTLDSDELVLLLEDDITPSRYAYRWLKAARINFSSREDVMGYTLQSEGVNRAKGKGPVCGPTTHPVFLYRLLGSWGFAPKPSVWRKFQDWFHAKRQQSSFKPYVPDLVMTTWYKKFELKGTQDSMWTMWFIYYTNSKDLYCVYNNLPAKLKRSDVCMAVHRRENGLHFHGNALNNTHLLLKSWEKTYVTFSKSVAKIDFDGNIAIEDIGMGSVWWKVERVQQCSLMNYQQQSTVAWEA
ncbi:hypothetical protein LSAT2_012562 [Lamellibrachia satsuma]|nr:hypothetical protein LSAT2_012562 [Lamellibrachia satsuma]